MHTHTHNMCSVSIIYRPFRPDGSIWEVVQTNRGFPALPVFGNFHGESGDYLTVGFGVGAPPVGQTQVFWNLLSCSTQIQPISSCKEQHTTCQILTRYMRSCKPMASSCLLRGGKELGETQGNGLEISWNIFSDQPLDHGRTIHSCANVISQAGSWPMQVHNGMAELSSQLEMRLNLKAGGWKKTCSDTSKYQSKLVI